MDITINATVTGTDGFYYREEHEWHNVVPEFDAWLRKTAAEAVQTATKLSSKGTGNLTASLGMTIDGTVQDPVVVSGFDYDDLIKFQKHVHRGHGELLNIAEQNAKRKTK